MRFEELLNREKQEGHREGCLEGHQKGLLEGQNQIIRLLSFLSADGLENEIPRLSTDPEFLKEMLEKYHLNDGDSIR